MLVRWKACTSPRWPQDLAANLPGHLFPVRPKSCHRSSLAAAGRRQLARERAPPSLARTHATCAPARFLAPFLADALAYSESLPGALMAWSTTTAWWGGAKGGREEEERVPIVLGSVSGEQRVLVRGTCPAICPPPLESYQCRCARQLDYAVGFCVFFSKNFFCACASRAFYAFVTAAAFLPSHGTLGRNGCLCWYLRQRLGSDSLAQASRSIGVVWGGRVPRAPTNWEKPSR